MALAFAQAAGNLLRMLVSVFSPREMHTIWSEYMCVCSVCMHTF